MYLAAFMPIIAAGLVPLIVGAVWYHPRVFGAAWMDQKHITPEMANRASKLSLATSLATLAFSMLLSAVLSYVLYALPIISVVHAMLMAGILFMGIVVPTTIHRLLWDHISPRLYMIEYGQWFVSFCMMAAILSM
jgi:hypothetical protein